MSNNFATAAGALQDAISSQGSVPLDALRGAIAGSYTLLFDESVGDRSVAQAVVDGVDEGYGLRLQSAAAQRMLPGWLRNLDQGNVADRAAFARDRDFAHSAFFDYVIRPEGRFHCLIATPYVTPTKRYHLIVGRPQHHAEFGQADAGMLRGLLPFVARLISLANDAATARTAADGMASAFDCLSENVVVLAAGGAVEFANAGARRLLAWRDGLAVWHGSLRGADMGSTMQLNRAIAAVQSPCGPEEASVRLPRPSSRPPLQVRLRRVPGALAPGGRHRAMLLIEQAARDTLEGWSAAKSYGLTEREADLAGLLAAGQDLRTAAATLGIAYQTARSHLRSVFAKTDLHRQSDLVRAVLSSKPGRR